MFAVCDGIQSDCIKGNNIVKFRRDLHMYKAVLIVPDIYNRGHLRELMNLLLLKMGFGSCFLVQVFTFSLLFLH